MTRSASSSSLSQDANKSLSSSVQVVVRLRPMNDNEKEHGTLPVVSASTKDSSVTIIKGQGNKQIKSKFMFDNVFTAFSTQEEVFEATLKPVIRDVMSGYESTVFAYGQTGTGKTHTMEGDLSNPDMYGVIPRSAQAIFERLKKPDYSSHTVKCSYLEIYNEELCDLLVDDRHGTSPDSAFKRTTKLEIMEGKQGTFCRGLIEKEVGSAEDVLNLMQTAQQQRRIGETKMNKHSSRSHCIFTVRITAKQTLMDGSILDFSGKLHMVDLAGSECAKTASLDKSNGAEVARDRERMNINRSLLTLGRVISLLKEQSENKRSNNLRIPYRDSKLTRILQESLGGRCKTLIFATVSPSVTAIEETISTLNYAQSANGIVNKPVATSFLSIASNKAHVTPLSSSDNKHTNEANSVEHWYEMECRLQYMQAEVEEARAALARKHMQQQDLVERAEKAESSCLEMEKKHFDAVQKVNVLTLEIDKKVEENKTLTDKLKQTEKELLRTTVILDATRKTEVAITSEANALLQTLKDSILECDIMHEKIISTRESDISKQNETKKFHQLNLAILQTIVESLNVISEQIKSNQESIGEESVQFNMNATQSISILEENLKTLFDNVSSWTESMKSIVNKKGGVIDNLKITSLNVDKSLLETKNVFEDSEHRLGASCESIYQKLDEYSNHIEKLGTNYQTIMNEALVSMEKNIIESKNKISHIVTAASDSLSNTSVSKAKLRGHMDELILGSISVSNDLSTQTKRVATINRESLSKLTDEFSNKMQCHEIMMESLNAQKEFMAKSQTSQLKGFEDQEKILREQRSEFEAAQEKQKQRNEEFLETVMNNVRDLISRQMSILAEEQKYQSIMIGKSNSKLSELNREMTSSARSTFENISSTGEEIIENIGKSKSKDLQMHATAIENGKAFNQINELMELQTKSTSQFYDKAKDQIQSMSLLDSHADDTFNLIRKTAESSKNFVGGDLYESSRGCMSMLNEANKEIMMYNTNVIIPSTKSSVSDMIKPRKKVSADITNNVQSIQSTLQRGTSKIQNLAAEQCNISDEFFEQYETKEKLNTEIIDEMKNRNTTFQKSLVEMSTEHTARSSAQIQESVARSSKILNNIEAFSTNVMHVDEMIPPVPERTCFVFNERISKTPSESVICRNLEQDILDTNGKENEAGDDRDRISPRNMEYRGSEGSEESLSVKSDISACPIPPSPGLKERSLNQDYIIVKSSSSKSFSCKKALPNRMKSRPRTTGTPTMNRKKQRITSTPNRAFLKSKRNLK